MLRVAISNNVKLGSVCFNFNIKKLCSVNFINLVFLRKKGLKNIFQFKKLVFKNILLILFRINEVDLNMCQH
jgi:hypothetical protein